MFAIDGNGVDELNQMRRYRKNLHLESLESRELLSGVSLLAEFGGYASTFGETEVRFEFQSNNDNAQKLDITLNSLQAGFDPSALRLQTSSGAVVSLTNVFNTTTQSGGSAFLAKGNYSIFFKADTGAGNFDLKISFVEATPVPDVSAMSIIAAAAVSQQKSGWDIRREYFNAALYSIAPEYGIHAFNGGKVIDLFPEADINKDGKLNDLDVQLVDALINNGDTNTQLQIAKPSTPIINPDQTPPIISATLNIPPQNGLTPSPIINGKITDQTGIKSAFYKINNSAEQQIFLANDGSFTILNNSSLAEGKYNITIIVTDNYGNVATSSVPEFTYRKQITTLPPATISDNGNGSITINTDFTITKIDDKNVAANDQITLPDNTGIITVKNNNITINAGSKYDYLAQNETTYLTLNVNLVDDYGKTYESELAFTIIGKNDAPKRKNDVTIIQNINENDKGTITVTEILDRWSDTDLSDTLSVASNVSLGLVEYSDAGLDSIFDENFLEALLSRDQNGGFIFDATDPRFAQLAENEKIEITLNYKITDGIALVDDKAKFIVTGKQSEIKLEARDNKTEINAGYTNDENTIKEVDFGFQYENPDAKNALYHYGITLKDSPIYANLIASFDENMGKFTIDTSKLIDRDQDADIAVTISILNGENVGIISQALTVKLTALLVIDNSTNNDYDPTHEIIVTKNDILDKLSLPGYEIIDIKGVVYVDGFDGVNEFAVNPFADKTIGIAKIDSNGDLVFTPDKTAAKNLSDGQWIKVKVEFSLQNIQNNSSERISSGIIIKITGKNDAPILIKTPDVLNINDNEIFEINWREYFDDFDLSDNALTLIAINGKTFVNETITVDSGIFYVEDSKLKFSPAEKFASLQSGKIVELDKFIFTVSDAAYKIVNGEFQINIVGTNKAPTAPTQNKTINNGENVTFGLGEVTDQNKADEHKIDKIEIKISENESITLDKSDTVNLDNGITITFDANNKTVMVDTSKRNKLPTDGEFEKVELIVTISDDYNGTCTTIWTMEIVNESPQIDNFLYTYIHKTKGNAQYEINLKDYIEDQNIPDRNENLPIWYKTSGLKVEVADDELKTVIGKSITLSEEGILTFTPTEELLNYLETNLTEGEMIDIKLTYLVTDNLLKDISGNFVSSEGELTLKIYGKKSAIIDIDDDSTVNLAEAEQFGKIEITNHIAISDPDGLTDDNKTIYDVKIDYTSIAISGGQSEKFESLDTALLFTIDDENNLVFSGNTTIFESLKVQEELVFNLNINVSDQYGTKTTQNVNFTIIGKGDYANVKVLTEELIVCGNKRNNNSESFEINFEIDDPDVGEGHTYSFGGLFSGSQKVELLDNVIAVNDQTGNITFDNDFFVSEFLTSLTSNSEFIISIIISGNDDKLETKVKLPLKIKFAQAPIIDEITPLNIDANEKIERAINVIENGDNVPRENGNYEYTDLKIAECCNLSEEIKDKIIASISDGKFTFDTDKIFEYLSVYEQVNLQFTFTVKDTLYNVESSGSIIVTINGINEKPVFNDNADVAVNTQATTDKNDLGVKIDLDKLFSDADKNDRHKIVSINNFNLTQDWQTIDGLGQFKYINTDNDGFGGELWFRAFVPSDADENKLAVLSAKPNELEFEIVVKDDSEQENNTETGTLKIIATGINVSPIIEGNIDEIIKVYEDVVSRDYRVDEFVTDKNKDDEFIFDSINGTKISDLSNDTNNTQTITLEDGVKIIISQDRKSFKIDATSRHENLEPNKIALNSIIVTVSDDSEAENAVSLPHSIQFQINGVNDKPQMNDQHFGINPHDSEIIQDDQIYIGFIPLTDSDTDTKNYNYSILCGENETNFPKFTVQKANNGAALYIAKDDIPELNNGGTSFYTFAVNAVCNNNDNESVTAQITVTFSANDKPEISFDETALNITENETEIVKREVTITLKEEDDDDDDTIENYSYTNIRFVEGKILDGDNSQSTIYSLPRGVEFGFDNNKFYVKPNGKFDLLGEGEIAELTFEFTVFDNVNNIGKISKINVTINGKNSAPVANNIKTEVDIPINDETGYGFNIDELFTDVDRNDTIKGILVNGESFDFFNKPIIDVYQNEIKYGTLEYETSSRCLIFKPDANSPIRAGETYLLKFQFTVTDKLNAEATGEITIGLRGVNKPPVFKENVVLNTKENELLIIEAEQLATDSNGDLLKIIKVKVSEEIIEISDKNEIITLESGAILTLTNNGQLIYDPTTRNKNLSQNSNETEAFSLIIADEYKTGSSNTDWKDFNITVNGVNDKPVANNPEQMEFIGNFKGEELKVKLSDYFSDPDNDILSYEIPQLGDNKFIEKWKIEDIENESYLIINFKPNIYSDETIFEPVQSNLKIRDDNGGEIEKTFTVKLPPTVKLDITADENIDGSYNVTVTAKDLINELVGFNYSEGFTYIKLSINVDPEFCEIMGFDSAGLVKKYNYAISVEFTADQIIELENQSEFNLVKFNIKTKKAGIAEFSIGNFIEIFRNNKLIDQSQIAFSPLVVVN
jgi:VCBS repeat-containing protein